MVQRLCRKAKDEYFNKKCEEIEGLDKADSKLLYSKIKDLQPRGSRVQQKIKDKHGTSLTEKEEILTRWVEYVEELYDDKNRRHADMGDLVNEVYTISMKEIRDVIRELIKKRKRVE